MLNSGQNAGHQTAGWTNFSQPCDTASSSSVRPLVCSTGNPIMLNLGESLGTTNGTVQNVYDGITDCWYGNPAFDRNADGIPDLPWTMTLPVIDCPGGAVGNCSDLVGAVEVHVVWITRNDKNQMNEVPRRMGDWPPVGSPLRDPTTFMCNGTGLQCWNSFVQYLQLKDILNGTDAFYEDKTIYFRPDCTPHVPTGITGGENFGILAKIPVSREVARSDLISLRRRYGPGKHLGPVHGAGCTYAPGSLASTTESAPRKIAIHPSCSSAATTGRRRGSQT